MLYLLRPLLIGLPPVLKQQAAALETKSQTGERVFRSLTAKYYTGLFELTKKLQQQLSPSNLETLERSIVTGEEQETSVRGVQARLILYDHLKLSAPANRMEKKLRSMAPADDEPTTVTLTSTEKAINRLYLQGRPFTADEAKDVEAGLSFPGKLAVLKSYQVAADPRAATLEAAINEDSLRTMLAVLTIFSGFALLGFLGFGLLILFLVQMRAKRIQSHFGAPGLPFHLFFETFTLYLLFMVLSHEAGERLSGPSLYISVALEFAVPLIALYPLIQGAKFRELTADIGVGKGQGFGLEFILGPAGYAAALPVVAAAAAFTSLLVQVSGANPYDAMHPIVPIVEGGTASTLLLVTVLFVAVIAAPIMEELMFRGFFYRALRFRYGPGPAIVLSAALFAGIHPQGYLGFPLLFTIGTALAVLREWRGSLIAPILAHACTNGVTMALLLSLAL